MTRSTPGYVVIFVSNMHDSTDVQR